MTFESKYESFQSAERRIERSIPLGTVPKLCACSHARSHHQRWLAITFPGVREDRYTSCLEDECECEAYEAISR